MRTHGAHPRPFQRGVSAARTPLACSGTHPDAHHGGPIAHPCGRGLDASYVAHLTVRALRETCLITVPRRTEVRAVMRFSQRAQRSTERRHVFLSRSALPPRPGVKPAKTEHVFIVFSITNLSLAVHSLLRLSSSRSSFLRYCTLSVLATHLGPRTRHYCYRYLHQ